MTEAPVSTILLATDLSARCDRAAERAAALAQQWNAALHVLTVVASDDHLDESSAPNEASVAVARRKAEDSIKGHAGAIIHVMTGAAETSIDVRAKQIGADLIVTGPSGGRWLGQTVLGRTVRSLMRLVRVPVLLVKSPANRRYRRVVVSMDLSDASRAPVEVAMRFFGKDASLSVFHAFGTPFRLFSDDVRAYEAGVRDGVTMEIREALRAWSVPDVEKVPVIADYGGDPATRLAELAVKHEIDVVVAGTHGRTGIMNLMLGSVAEAIVETVTCDLLIAPSRGAWHD